MEDQILLPCRIQAVKYASENFSVLEVVIDDSSDYFPRDSLVVPTEWTFEKMSFIVQISTEFEGRFDEFSTYVFSGQYNDHPRYGPQFKSNYFFPDIPSNEKMIREYLKNMPQIGYVRAKMIVDRFGESKVVDIFENTPEMLLEIDGINEARLKDIKESWEGGKAKRDTYMWLTKNSIPYKFASEIIKRLGNDAVLKITENPYVLTSIRGMGFTAVDGLAHRMLEEVPGEMRVLYCMRHIMKKIITDGHLCAPIDNLKRVVKSCLEEYKEQPHFDSFFRSAISEHFVVVRNRGRMFVYSPSIFDKERSVASNLSQISAGSSNYEVDDSDIEYAEGELYSHIGREISLDDIQAEAIRSAFENRITVISGGGGTGKSTICRCIRTIAMKKGLTVTFVAPTGAAAKVLGEKTSTDASTIHRLLGMTPGSGPKDDAVIADNILVVDEFSMVGIDTLPYLLDAIGDKNITNIVFVGDPQQLPSVSAGNFLSDVISSGISNVVILDTIHRQSETSYIPIIADAMSNGTYVGIPEDSTDVSLVEVRDDAAALARINIMVQDYNSEHGSLDGLQVISPMYRGYAGVDSLCNSVQAMVSDDHSDVMNYKNKTFYMNDRVMHTVNNYDKDVYNGNIGRVVSIGSPRSAKSFGKKLDIEIELAKSPGAPSSSKGKMIVVDYDGREVEYHDDDMDELRVCWCCTVHKYQGSQINSVILVAMPSQENMMSRELIYTGMTRASEKLTIVGSERMLRKASSVSVIKKRFTNTSDMIKVASGTVSVEGFSVANKHLCS